MFFINGGRALPREESIGVELPRIMRYTGEGTGYGCWAVFEQATGAFVGWIMLVPPKGGTPDVPELGYRLRRSAWGQGYATEGARALVRRAFTQLPTTRVFATTMTVNHASRRVMEKAGLHYVRTFFAEWPDRIPGDEFGDVEYAATREEWLGANPGPDTTA